MYFINGDESNTGSAVGNINAEEVDGHWAFLTSKNGCPYFHGCMKVIFRIKSTIVPEPVAVLLCAVLCGLGLGIWVRVGVRGG